MQKTVKIHELDKDTAFTFQGDTNRPKDIYWFGGCDGPYAKIFETKKDLKNFHRPAFVGCTTVVVPEETA